MHGPDSSLFHFQVFTQSAPAPSLDKSAALTFGWPWHPAGSTCFVCDSFIPHASLSLRSDFSIPPLLSHSDLPLSKKFKMLSEQRAPKSRCDLQKKKKKLRICFCTQIGQCSNWRKGLICLINPSRALQEFRMIRSEFTRFVLCFYLSFHFFVLSFVLVLSSIPFHSVSSTKVN